MSTEGKPYIVDKVGNTDSAEDCLILFIKPDGTGTYYGVADLIDKAIEGGLFNGLNSVPFTPKKK